jgi:hypothetical protein
MATNLPVHWSNNKAVTVAARTRGRTMMQMTVYVMILWKVRNVTISAYPFLSTYHDRLNILF